MSNDICFICEAPKLYIDKWYICVECDVQAFDEFGDLI